MKSGSQVSTISKQCLGAASSRHPSSDLITTFWQQWQQYRDSLYRCCIKWMGGNPTDAEDALSRAMLKAWEKVQKYAVGEIANFKAWLTKLTYNLCIDIYRERSRGANQVEDIEAIPEEKGMICFDNTPESALETDEKKIVIRHAIDNLPTRLRETFILHFYQELSHQEISEQQGISYQNVCKRISQARAILVKELRGYFIGEDESNTDKSVTPTPAATDSSIEEISQGNTGVEAIVVGDSVTLSVAVEEVESVGIGKESMEVVRPEHQEESASLWQNVKKDIQTSEDSAIIFDDTVLDKRLSEKNDLVRRQYSGIEDCLLSFVGLVNCVYVNPKLGNIIQATNPPQIITNTFPGDDTSWVWINADSQQDSQNATITLQSLS